MTKKTTLSLYALLITSVSAVDGSAKSVEDARFAARLATFGDIPADKLLEVASIVDKKLFDLANGDGDHVTESYQLLQQVRAGVVAQTNFYMQYLASIENEDQLTLDISNDKVVVDQSIGKTQAAGGMIGGGAVHRPIVK